MEAGDRQWEVEEDTLLRAIDVVQDALHREPFPYLFMGGIASAVHGRPRWTHDIDLFVRPEHARHVLEALGRAGLSTEEYDSYWLFKAFSDDVLVDVIFRSHGDIYVDDAMVAHHVKDEFRGRTLPLISPEDLLIIKALVHAEYSPRHWHDALALIARCDIDWDYVVQRARYGPRRVLSLLLYAQSNDLAVPDRVIETVYATLAGG